MTTEFLWVADPSRAHDLHVGFRATFDLPRAADLELEVLGASWYNVFLDGAFIGEGPARFEPDHPEYSVIPVRVEAGNHVLAAHVHDLGVDTRMQAAMPPFLSARLRDDGDHEVPLRWRCAELPGYTATGRRSSPLFGWLEWVDSRALPGWTEQAFDDSGWAAAFAVERRLGTPAPLQTEEVRHRDLTLTCQASGLFVETMPFFELDDPAVRFLTADLTLAADGPVDGVWRRYDLGRVRLGTPRMVLSVPEGSVVEMGSAEFLTSDRVAPVYPGSTGPTCNVDHVVARGGRQEFRPLHPRGMRYLEVHVTAPPSEVDFLEEAFVERSYFGPPVGSLSTGDALLDRVWKVSVDTLRACSEDALVDCPTRERGQWLGDVAVVGLEVAAVAYPDLRLIARGLRQAAWSADAQGVLSGLSPGPQVVLATYSLQAVTGVLRYHRLTGDRGLVDELYPALVRSVAPFVAALTPEGLDPRGLPPVFVDWGYEPRPAGTDMALNLHALLALGDLCDLSAMVGRDCDQLQVVCDELRRAISSWLNRCLSGPAGWQEVGYHCTVLALRAGLVPAEMQPSAVSALKAHIMSCFPNDPGAPRQDHPLRSRAQLVTPYFGHYAFPELIERGEMDFVLDQYRNCWGWMLDQGATTWLEVFDTRWSHCHQWSGAPAWHLSRYLLGLWPRFDRGSGEFEFKLIPGDLRQAAGVVPLPGGPGAAVRWTSDGETVRYSLTSPQQLTLRSSEGRILATGSAIRFNLAAGCEG